MNCPFFITGTRGLCAKRVYRWTRAAVFSFLFCAAAHAADTEGRLKQLEQQNQSLQQKLAQQQALIDELARKLSSLSSKSAEAPPVEDSAAKRGYNLGQVRISGEGGVGVFHSSGTGRYTESDFRVDEARLFVEAPLWENYAFAFAELELMTRERQTTVSGGNPIDDGFHLGEFYVDFEGVSRLWNKPGMLGIRIGRLDVPFGEEYISRDVIDNPLISHSLSDFWGIDEGIEAYGSIGKFDYVFAVQNGGHPMLADYNRDKSLTARVGWNPANWLRLSASAMRTGDLDATSDKMSEIWFGNGFIRPIAASATLFEAAVYEGDVQTRWKNGHFKAAGGLVEYSDNAPARANSDRNVYYYYAEALQQVPSLPKLYGAARFSQIFAAAGFPIVGHGQFGAYFYNPANATDGMWRASLGGGYRFSDHLTLKLEYSLDRRSLLNRRSEDTHLLAAEVGFAF